MIFSVGNVYFDTSGSRATVSSVSRPMAGTSGVVIHRRAKSTVLCPYCTRNEIPIHMICILSGWKLEIAWPPFRAPCWAGWPITTRPVSQLVIILYGQKTYFSKIVERKQHIFLFYIEHYNGGYVFRWGRFPVSRSTKLRHPAHRSLI